VDGVDRDDNGGEDDAADAADDADDADDANDDDDGDGDRDGGGDRDGDGDGDGGSSPENRRKQRECPMSEPQAIFMKFMKLLIIISADQYRRFKVYNFPINGMIQDPPTAENHSTFLK
jgi:hypothetical protein